MKERDLKSALVDQGLRHGVLTYDEVNDALPAEFFSLQELEDFFRLLERMGIDVVETEGRRRARMSSFNHRNN